MDIKSFFALITIAAASLQASYADGFALQDSVKTVYVKVVASEKVPVEEEPATERPEKVSVYTGKPNRASTAKKTSFSTPKTASKQTAANPRLQTSKEDNSTVSIIIKKVDKTAPRSIKTESAKSQQKTLEDKANTATAVSNAEPALANNQSILQTSRTYLWVGTALVVIGMILGILFGKTALLVSIAGIVFVIIGYTIKA